jgi:hypothetical protein
MVPSNKKLLAQIFLLSWKERGPGGPFTHSVNGDRWPLTDIRGEHAADKVQMECLARSGSES